MLYDTETLRQILHGAGCTEQDVTRILALQEAGRQEDVLSQLKKQRCACMQQLHEQLSVMQAVDGINTVCVVDESHLLSFEMLEEIRFLMNMKFDSVSPVALILSGQTELWKNRLSLKKCEAIRQRIDIQSVLNHYDRARTGEYIRHQLSYAGAQSDIFTEKAIDSRAHHPSSGPGRQGTTHPTNPRIKSKTPTVTSVQSSMFLSFGQNGYFVLLL